VPTEAGQKIQYKLNLRKGQSYYVRVISDSNVAQEMMGQKSVVEVTAGFGYRFDVKEVDEKGNGWVDCTFDWVKFRQKAPMMEVAYDSANKVSPVPAGAQGVAVFLGAGFSAKITPQGQGQQSNCARTSKPRFLKDLRENKCSMPLKSNSWRSP
jgi:hypothetical protein